MMHLFSFTCTAYLMGWILIKDHNAKRQARRELDKIRLQHTKIQVEFLANQLLQELESVAAPELPPPVDFKAFRASKAA